MSGESTKETLEIRIPQSEDAAHALVAEDRGEELSKQEKNLITAQAELIGDL